MHSNPATYLKGKTVLPQLHEKDRHKPQLNSNYFVDNQQSIPSSITTLIVKNKGNADAKTAMRRPGSQNFSVLASSEQRRILERFKWSSTNVAKRLMPS